MKKKYFHNILWFCYIAFLAFFVFFAPFGSPAAVKERMAEIMQNRAQGFYNINLIPLRDTIYVFQFRIWSRMILLGLNFVLFMPFGLKLRKVPLVQICLWAFAISIFKEGLQFVFCLGVFDIDDMLFNFSGVLTGWFIGRRFPHLMQF